MSRNFHIFLGYHEGVRDLRFGPENLRVLQSLGQVRLHRGEKALTTPQMIEAAAGCQVVVSDRLTPGEAAFFDAASDVVAYVRTVTDLKNVDVEAASRNGILVTACSATFVDGCSEWIVGQMIALSRHFVDYVGAYRSGWIPDLASGPRGRQLKGRTAGIIGLGRIGRRTGELLAAFGMRVLAHSPRAEDWPPGIEPAEFDTLLAESDFVIPLTRHTAETESLISEAALRRMKPTAFLVNAGRGPLVDEAALERALLQGDIAGAALDVGSGEGDVPPLRLARLSNVLATPHVSPSVDANWGQGREAVAMVADILAGRMPTSALNPVAADRFTRFAASRSGQTT